jgi:hypothetical protein
MLFGETVAVYCKNRKEDTDKLCEQNAQFKYIKVGGTYSNHWALKVWIGCDHFTEMFSIHCL